MTDWVDNKIYVCGDAIILEKFVTDCVSNGVFDINKVAPLPVDFSSLSDSEKIKWYGDNVGFEKTSLNSVSKFNEYCRIDIDSASGNAYPLCEKIYSKYGLSVLMISNLHNEFWMEFLNKDEGGDVSFHSDRDDAYSIVLYLAGLLNHPCTLPKPAVKVEVTVLSEKEIEQDDDDDAFSDAEIERAFSEMTTDNEKK